MAYTPTNWQTGDIVTAEKLNKLENGVQNAIELPSVTAEDDGDVLTVVSGAWAKAQPSGGDTWVMLCGGGANDSEVADTAGFLIDIDEFLDDDDNKYKITSADVCIINGFDVDCCRIVEIVMPSGDDPLMVSWYGFNRWGEPMRAGEKWVDVYIAVLNPVLVKIEESEN